LFFFNALAFPAISSKSLKFQSELFSTPTRFRHNFIFFQRLGGFAGQQKAAIRDFAPVLVLIQPAARTVAGFLNLDAQSRKPHQRGNSTRALVRGNARQLGADVALAEENILNGEPCMLRLITSGMPWLSESPQRLN
jgi:hypothetical protein